MPEPHVLAFLAGCLLCGAFVRSIIGFGDALVAMPLMVLLVPLKTATPLMSLCSATVGLGLLAFDWRHVDVAKAWRIVAGAAAGLPLGVLLLRTTPVGYGRIALGLFVIVFILYDLVLAVPEGIRRLPALPYLFGFLAGTFGGFFTTPGPPVVAYGRLEGWPADRFRATMTGYAVPFGVMMCLGHGIGGFWTRTVFVAYGWAMPGLVVGLLLGNVVHRIVPQHLFRRVVQVVLSILGVVLVVQGIDSVS